MDNGLRFKILSILLLLSLATSFGQESGEITPTPSTLNIHQWGSLNLFHGLPSNHVRAIAQDNDGIMWFGTDSGLAKYDGRRIQKVVEPGLPQGKVLALKVGEDGTLWVGTDTGAARLISSRFKPVTETGNKAITAFIMPDRAHTVIASEQGTIFICSPQSDGLLNAHVIGPTDTPLLRQETTSNNTVGNPLVITSLSQTKDDIILGTRGRGLLSLDGNDIKEIVSHPRSFFVNTTFFDARGHLWFGADASRGDSGLYISDNILRPEKVDVETGAVKALAQDKQGDLWIATDGQGAFHLRDGRPAEHFTFENTAGGLRSNSILSIFVDREGVIWFGTDRGVCRYDPHSPRIESVSDRAESNFVRALYKAKDGREWCGTNRGLFTRDPLVGGWKPVEDLTGKTIHSINEDESGHILIGTAGGLYAETNDPFSLLGWYKFAKVEKNPDNTTGGESVRAITHFRGAIYMAGFGRGLEKLDGGSRVLLWPLDATDPKQRNVVSLYSDGDEKLWIGTADDGIYYFDGQRVTTDPVLKDIHDESVWSVAGNSKDGLWFATSRGLYRYSEGKLQQILHDSNYRQVVASDDSKSAWCATGNGLFRIVFDDTAGQVINRLDTEKGLPSDNVFTILPVKTENDTVLWLGTNRGVAYYQPGNVPAKIQAVRILGRRVYQPEELPAGLHLAYPQNSLLVEVAANSSRTFPEQFQYLFLLFDNTGHLIKKLLSADSQFQMENLKPGGYRVVARAYTNDLVVSDPLEFHFDVAKAPFPLTSTALGALLAVALVALWFGYRQNRRIVDANVALAGANQQLAETRMQLANETENERRRIARDLHDQTLSDLRRLMLLTDQLPKSNNGGSVDPKTFRSEIESISTEIRHICEDLSPSVLANVGLGAALEWALYNTVAHLPEERKFEYDFASVEDLEEHFHLDPGEQIQIYRIVQEAISNIGQHADAQHVSLRVAITETSDLLIRLEDDGNGFDTEHIGKKTGRGLTNIRSRASLIDADVTWQKKTDRGIIFTLSKSHRKSSD